MKVSWERKERNIEWWENSLWSDFYLTGILVNFLHSKQEMMTFPCLVRILELTPGCKYELQCLQKRRLNSFGRGKRDFMAILRAKKTYLLARDLFWGNTFSAWVERIARRSLAISFCFPLEKRGFGINQEKYSNDKKLPLLFAILARRQQQGI